MNDITSVRIGSGTVLSASPVDDRNNALNTTDPLSSNRLSAFGEVMVAQFTPMAAWRADYGTAPNTRLYTTTGTANGGTVTINQSRLLLQTSAAANGVARIQTRNRLRYMPGVGGMVRFTAVFDEPTADSYQIMGLGDTQDGFFFGYVGTTFGVIVRRAGSDTFIAAQNWNGIPLDFSPQNGNVYQIRFQWLGFGFIQFYAQHPTRPYWFFIPMHTVLYPNTTNVTSILNPTLPLMAEVGNTGNTSNMLLISPSAVAGLEGRIGEVSNPLNVPNSKFNSAVFSDTNNNHLITIRNKSTFGGVANRVPVDVISFVLSRSQAGAPLSEFELYEDATFAAPLVFADVDTANSPVEFSVTTTTIVTGTVLRGYLLADNASSVINNTVVRDSILLYPGEMLTISITDSTNAAVTAAATLNWIEEF